MTDIQPIGNTDDILREAEERKLDTQLAPLPAQAIRPINVAEMEYIFTYKLPLLNYLLAVFYIQIITIFALIYAVRLSLGRGIGSVPSLNAPSLGLSYDVSGYVALGIASLLVLTLLSRVSLLRYVAIVASIVSIGYFVYSAGLVFAALSPYGTPAIQYSVLVYAPYVVLISLLIATIIHLSRPKIARAYRK